MSDFNITYFEACELLNRSKKSLSRYIRRGLLHPERVKSQQGTLEYRFSKADLEAFKAQEALNADQTRPDGTDKTGHLGETGQDRRDTIKPQKQQNSGEVVEIGQDQTGQDRTDGTRETGQDNEVITLLKETTGLLRDQLKTKDEQIKDLGGKIDQLIERDRETNILLKGLQDKVLMLEQAKTEQAEPINAKQSRETTQTAQDTPQEAKSETTETRQDKPEETGQTRGDGTRQDEPKPAKAGFWKRVFKNN